MIMFVCEGNCFNVNWCDGNDCDRDYFYDGNDPDNDEGEYNEDDGSYPSPDYSTLKSSDFIFGFADSKDVWVWITPKEYYVKTGFADDSGKSPNDLPNFMFSEMEGTYSSTESLEDTKKALLDLGFVYDKGFEDYCRSFQEPGDIFDQD
jgi:hypothetical protein